MNSFFSRRSLSSGSICSKLWFGTRREEKSHRVRAGAGASWKRDRQEAIQADTGYALVVDLLHVDRAGVEGVGLGDGVDG